MKQFGWGLIGCGDIAQKRVAPALRDSPLCEFVAVARSRSDLAESFAEQFGARKWYANQKELLRDDEINAVYLATPVHLHSAQAIASAEAGKHVLCEKPMAMNVGECDRMIAACRANNVKLGVAYYRHFYPIIGGIKSIIETGEIGVPVLAQINAFERSNPPSDHPRSWLLKNDLAGGGPMFDFGCHRIEVLTNIFGPIAEIRATRANVLFDREVEDTAMVLFQFEQGVCGVLTVTHTAFEPQDTLEVFGALGSIHVRVVNEKGERWESQPPSPNLHAPLIEDFVDAVLTNREPAVCGKKGRAVALIEEEIYRASKSGGNF